MLMIFAKILKYTGFLNITFSEIGEEKTKTQNLKKKFHQYLVSAFVSFTFVNNSKYRCF